MLEPKLVILPGKERYMFRGLRSEASTSKESLLITKALLLIKCFSFKGLWLRKFVYRHMITHTLQWQIIRAPISLTAYNSTWCDLGNNNRYRSTYGTYRWFGRPINVTLQLYYHRWSGDIIFAAGESFCWHIGYVFFFTRFWAVRRYKLVKLLT